jgi:hypothetical protein
MPTAKQWAANRQNARESTGPRSPQGKARVGKNAYRHGLSISAISSPAFEKEVETLARQIAEVDRVNLDDARTLAAAEVDLDRIQRVKTALIDRMHVFGAFDPPFLFHSTAEEVRWIRSILFGKVSGFPQPPDPSATLPTQEPARTTEAIFRALPELLKLDRYEKSASARRDRAIRQIANSLRR